MKVQNTSRFPHRKSRLYLYPSTSRFASHALPHSLHTEARGAPLVSYHYFRADVARLPRFSRFASLTLPSLTKIGDIFDCHFKTDNNTARQSILSIYHFKIYFFIYEYAWWWAVFTLMRWLRWWRFDWLSGIFSLSVSIWRKIILYGLYTAQDIAEYHDAYIHIHWVLRPLYCRRYTCTSLRQFSIVSANIAVYWRALSVFSLASQLATSAFAAGQNNFAQLTASP